MATLRGPRPLGRKDIRDGFHCGVASLDTWLVEHAASADAGTMSAWLVFAMSGFYTIAGTDTYLVGSPTLTHVTMHLPGGDLVVDAPDASDAAPYVQSASLDGHELDVAHFSQADVEGGMTLHLEMGAVPSQWGTTAP